MISPPEPASPLEITVDGPGAMEDLGVRLAALVRAGDLLVLTGPLGAGKTTLIRGLGRGLAVRGAVTSPTFVLARVHPSLSGGPALVHVDAYRLSGPAGSGSGSGSGRTDVLAEVDALDLDADLDESVTVVEWGAGKVEQLSPDRLEVRIDLDSGDRRRVRLDPVGPRWAGFTVPDRTAGSLRDTST